MENTKLTIRISKTRLEKAKVFARQNKTSLSHLVDEYLGLLTENKAAGKSPLVKQLSGILSSNLDISDYKDHLAKKYHA
jgi:hypothetical protein